MKLSIIIPVYNAGKYLKRCLDSILINNDSNEIEIICVNDGSDDDSLQILYEYAEKFSLLKVINQTNHGVSTARNNGMKMAEGEYIMFVDADDYISSDTLQTFISITEKASCDMSIASMARVSKRGKLSICRLNSKVYEASNLWRLMKELDVLTLGSPCLKMFKQSIIKEHNIKFDVTMALYEDATFVMSYLSYCAKVITSDLVLYNYVTNWTSATAKYRGNDFLACLSNYRNAQFDCLRKLDTPLNELKSIQAAIDKSTAYQLLFAIYTIYRAPNRPKKNKYLVLKMYISDYQYIMWGGVKRGIPYLIVRSLKIHPILAHCLMIVIFSTERLVNTMRTHFCIKTC